MVIAAVVIGGGVVGGKVAGGVVGSVGMAVVGSMSGSIRKGKTYDLHTCSVSSLAFSFLGHSISNQRKIKRDPFRFLSNLVRSEYL